MKSLKRDDAEAIVRDFRAVREYARALNNELVKMLAQDEFETAARRAEQVISTFLPSEKSGRKRPELSESNLRRI